MLTHTTLGQPGGRPLQAPTAVPRSRRGTHGSIRPHSRLAGISQHMRCSPSSSPAPMALCLVIENAQIQIYLSDPADGDVAVHLREETDLQAPITRDAQIHRQAAGEREFTGQGIAERLGLASRKELAPNQLLERLQGLRGEQPGGASMQSTLLNRQAAVECLHVGDATGALLAAGLASEGGRTKKRVRISASNSAISFASRLATPRPCQTAQPLMRGPEHRVRAGARWPAAPALPDVGPGCAHRKGGMSPKDTCSTSTSSAASAAKAISTPPSALNCLGTSRIRVSAGR